jgi:hypothetical protein
MTIQDRPVGIFAIFGRQLLIFSAALSRAGSCGGTGFVPGLVIAAVVGAITFHRFGGSLFFSVDSAAYLAQANEFLRHQSSFFAFGANYIESLGDMYWPVNFGLLPDFRAAFNGSHVDPVRFYFGASLLIFAVNYVLARVVGLRRAATFHALALLALTMPYTTTWFYTDMFSWLDPRWLPFLYLEPAVIVAFLLIGRYRLWVSACAIVAFVALCLWTIGALPKSAFIPLGATFVYAGAFTLGASSRVEAALKVTAGALFLLLFLVGPLDFMRGLYGYTTNAAMVPWVEVRNAGDVATTVRALLGDLNVSQQFMFARFILGTPLFVGGVLGGLVAISKWRSERTIALFGASTLLLIAASIPFFYGTVLLGAIYPNVVLATVILLVEVVDRIGRHLQLPSAARGSVAPLANASIVLGAVAIIVLCYKSPKYAGIPYPPKASSVVDYVGSRIRFASGSRFRGRFVNLAGRVPSPDRGQDTLTAQVLASEMSFAGLLGNDLTFSGLGYFEIPTPQEFNRFASPRNLAFFGRFLTAPDARQTLDYRVISLPDPKFLGLIGVRYVLSDEPLRGLASVAVSLPSDKLVLYRLDEANIGQYSPTIFSRSSNFATMLDAMATPAFDPRRDLVTDDDVPATTTLLPARSAAVTRAGAGLHVQAESDGRSILVLPFEYSRCLVITRGAATVTRLFRADFLLTGIEFDRKLDADLTFRFGPFTNPQCRQQDIADARREGLDYAGFAAYRRQHPDLFVYPWLH